MVCDVCMVCVCCSACVGCGVRGGCWGPALRALEQMPMFLGWAQGKDVAQEAGGVAVAVGSSNPPAARLEQTKKCLFAEHLVLTRTFHMYRSVL